MKMEQVFKMSGSGLGTAVGAATCVLIAPAALTAATIVVGTTGMGWFLGRRLAHARADDLYESGKSYDNEENINHDYSKALECYKQAIEYNPSHANALYRLGFLYHHGLYGRRITKQGWRSSYKIDETVPVDLVKAKKYYQKAAQEGHYYAQAELEKILAKEESDRQANEYYQTASIVKGLGWTAYQLLNGTSGVINLAGQYVVQPAADLIADQTGLPIISTATQIGLLGAQVAANPIGFAVGKGTNYLAHQAIDSMELTNPVLKATLKVSADIASPYAANAVVASIMPSSTSTTSEESTLDTDNEDDIRELLKHNFIYMKKENGNGGILQHNPAHIAALKKQGNTFEVWPTKNVPQKNSQNPQGFFSSQQKSDGSSKELEVFFFEEQLKVPVIKHANLYDKRAMHTGFIVKDPMTGTLTQFEISIDGKWVKTNQINITDINKFKTNDSQHLCRVGATHLSIDEIKQKTGEWANAHPNYKYNDTNCRSFTDSMLRDMMLQKGTLAETLNPEEFSKSPSEACNHRISKHKKEEPKSIRSHSP